MAGNFVILGPTAKVVICRLTNLAAVVVASGATAIATQGGLILGVRAGQGEYDRDNPDATDTNDTPFKSSALGNMESSWSISTYRQVAGTLANGPPHASGVNAMNLTFANPTNTTTPSSVTSLLVYPNGTESGAAGTITVDGNNIVTALGALRAYIIPYFLVHRFSPSLRVDSNSAPQEANFVGKSSGIFGIPSLV